MATTYDNGVYIGQMSPQEGFANDWENALAQYQARSQQPRSDVFGQTLQQDTPEALKAELFAPLQEMAMSLAGRGRRDFERPRPFQFRSTGGGELLRVDPNSGTADVVRQARPSMGQKERMDYQDLLRQRTTLLGNQFALMTAEGKKKLVELDAAIGDFEEQQQVNPFSEPSFAPAPPANQGFIGSPDGANVFNPSPFGDTTVPVSPSPANGLKITGIRRK